MRAELFQAFAETTLAASVALVLVGLLRKPMRAAVGARAAYLLWLLVPAMATAVLLPAPPALLSSRLNLVPEQISSTFTRVTSGESASEHALFTSVALTIWSIGAGAMLFSMLARQRVFERTLGVLTRDADGLYRGDVAAPMIVGAWHSKIVVPTDFEARYSPEERELVLAHERAHQARHDVAVNTIASFALCLFWFNPLMYRALAWLRLDQELACDALVLSQRDDARRRYAHALLRTQLATESARHSSVGCHWQSAHPLKERIVMLKRSLPTRPRRLAGLAFVAALTGVASYAAWSGQVSMIAGPSILVDLKITISNPQTHEIRALATQYLVHSGETIQDANGRPLDFACTPYFVDESERSTDWSDQRARGIPLSVAGRILLDCAIRRDGEIVQRPAVIVKDGEPARIETAESGGRYLYRFEVTASTSQEKIAAAKNQSGK